MLLAHAAKAFSRLPRSLALTAVLSLASACALIPAREPAPAPPTTPAPERREPTPLPRELKVQASAYNSLREQTSEHPTLTAFGVHLRPGMQVIAVSRDLYARGLREGTRVTIEGLPGEWKVADKMARRWRNKIDIYMGNDVAAAKRWGSRKVTLRLR